MSTATRINGFWESTPRIRPSASLPSSEYDKRRKKHLEQLAEQGRLPEELKGKMILVDKRTRQPVKTED